MKMEYYIIHSKPGFEDRIEKALKTLKDQEEFKGKIGEIIIPQEEIIDLRKKEQKPRRKKFLPGYVIVQMEMVSDLYWAVRKIAGVSGFLGGKDPLPLRPEEVVRIKELEEEGKREKARPQAVFEKGDAVRIMEGPFTNFMGTIEEIEEEKGRIKVMVNILGRFTPVELKIYQVEKM
ncbi:MAG TPA: transcription termination/antitermination protein NusG [bacterium]|nr:transcription termination/antitermination protein NusG [bacterium]